jgi:hypothetical protein
MRYDRATSGKAKWIMPDRYISLDTSMIVNQPAHLKLQQGSARDNAPAHVATLPATTAQKSFKVEPTRGSRVYLSL